jgi:hypothetical protein
MLRGWEGKGNCRMVIKVRDGAWEITFTSLLGRKRKNARGIGETFTQAWDNTVSA